MTLKWSPGFTMWDPSELGADLALWLDASDASTITLNGSNVSQWDDKSGNGNHVVQTLASKQPAYTAGAITHDGSGDMLVADSPIITADASGAFTLFSVSTMISGENGYFYGTADDTGGFGFYQADTEFSLTDRTNGAVNRVLHNGFGQRVFGVVYDNDTTDYSFDGTVQNTTYNYSFPSALTSFTVGNRINGTAPATYWNGTHHEIVVTSTALSTIDRQKLEGYLAWKWGLTANLPSNHPYKFAPPQ